MTLKKLSADIYLADGIAVATLAQAFFLLTCNHPSYRLHVNRRTKQCKACGHIINEGNNL